MRRKILLLFMIILIQFQLPVQAIEAYQKAGQMTVHFINVGQGDSVLIETPNQKTILIDGGPPKAADRLLAYLEKENIKAIDLIIATHPDFDHIGGLPDVMGQIPVKQIIETGKFHLTKTYAKYAATIFLKQIPVTIVEKGDLIQLDPALRLELLNSSAKGKDTNASSLALKLTYDEIVFLLMADVEREQEQQIMKDNDVSANIIKIAHHGSKTSSSSAFLADVQADIAILTYSQSNSFGHPANRVIKDLQRLSSLIYSTAVFGTIVVESDGKDYIILPEKNPFDALSE